MSNPIVLEPLIGGFDFPRRDADDQNPVSLRHEFGGLWVCHFHLFGRLLKQIRQSTSSAFTRFADYADDGFTPCSVIRNHAFDLIAHFL